MMYGILASLVPLAFMALIGFAAGRTIYIGLTLPKPLRGKDSAGVCGACHYPVTRGHGQICPECGRAHADAGILTPVLSKSMRPSASSVVAGWILLLLMCYIVAISVISVIISPTSVAEERLVVTIAFALAGLLVLVLIGLGVWSVARRNRSSRRRPSRNTSVGLGPARAPPVAHQRRGDADLAGEARRRAEEAARHRRVTRACAPGLRNRRCFLPSCAPTRLKAASCRPRTRSGSC